MTLHERWRLRASRRSDIDPVHNFEHRGQFSTASIRHGYTSVGRSRKESRIPAIVEQATAAATPVLPTAQDHTRLAPDQILHSVNAGVIAERTGQIKNEFRSEARKFALEVAEYMNITQVSVASVFLNEETFGTKLISIDQPHHPLELKVVLTGAVSTCDCV